MAEWLGRWRNQYGSIVEVTAVDGDRVEGSFTTALEDSGFFGQTVPIVGVARGNCIAFSSVGTGPAGDMVVSYTGLLRDGRLETMWFYAGDEAQIVDDDGVATRKPVPWWKAVVTNADTFERDDEA